MYAAKLAAESAENGAKSFANGKLARATTFADPSDSAAGELEAANAFSAEKLMAWLSEPTNKARMYARKAGLAASEGVCALKDRCWAPGW